MEQQINAEALLDCAAVLRALTPEERERFDMAYFVQASECGTIGCAFGWYAMKRPELGFRVVPQTRDVFLSTATGWHAVDAAFSINDKQAYHLFCDLAYSFDPSPDDVAARIESFVKNNGAIDAPSPSAAGRL